MTSVALLCRLGLECGLVEFDCQRLDALRLGLGETDRGEEEGEFYHPFPVRGHGTVKLSPRGEALLYLTVGTKVGSVVSNHTRS